MGQSPGRQGGPYNPYLFGISKAAGSLPSSQRSRYQTLRSCQYRGLIVAGLELCRLIDVKTTLVVDIIKQTVTACSIFQGAVVECQSCWTEPMPDACPAEC